jgi:hypothetical protein
MDGALKGQSGADHFQKYLFRKKEFKLVNLPAF